MRLTTETLEVWSVTRGEGGGSGTEALETRHALSSQVEGALGVRKACLLDLAIAGNTFGVSAEGEASPRWGVDLVVLVISTGEDGGGGGRGEENAVFSVHLVRVFSSGEASWARSAATVKVCRSLLLCLIEEMHMHVLCVGRRRHAFGLLAFTCFKRLISSLCRSLSKRPWLLRRI